MALSKFKNIDDVLKKGTSLTTELSSTEFKLIDKGFIPTPFDIGNNDVLEFLLYDSNISITKSDAPFFVFLSHPQSQSIVKLLKIFLTI